MKKRNDNKKIKRIINKDFQKSLSFVMAVIMTLSLLNCNGMSFFVLRANALEVNNYMTAKTISDNHMDDLSMESDKEENKEENKEETTSSEFEDSSIDIICDDGEIERLGEDKDVSSPHISDNGYVAYDIVEFGEYEGETIKWMVLDDKDDSLLLLSEKIIEGSKEELTVEWVNSPIRRWLNNDFYQNAFNTTEQKAIKENVNGNGYGNPIYSYISSGTDTRDKIFLLSYEEVINTEYGFDEYSFATDEMRRAGVTPHAKDNGVFVSMDEPFPGNGYWWLRTAGKTNKRVACVTATGVVYAAGYNLDEYDGGIRPAMWVDKQKVNIEKKGNFTNVDLSVKSTRNVYNGKAQPLISLTNCDESIDYEFSLNGEDYSSEVPKAINAGEYKIYCKAIFSDGKIVNCVLDSEITKRSVVASDIKLKQNSFEFDENKGIVVPDFEIEDYPKDGCRNILSKEDYTIYGSTSGKKEGRYSITIVANEAGNYYGQKNIDWYIVRDTVLILGQKKDIKPFFLSDENKEKNISKYVITEGEKLASINKAGVIKPKRTGKITVEAYENLNGETIKISSCSFEIIKPAFNPDMMQARYDGWTVDLSKAIEIPSTQKVTFKSNKKKIATIDNETGILNIHTDKSTKVTVTASYTNVDGNKVDIQGKFVIKIPKMSTDKINIKNGNSEKLKIKEIVNEEIQQTRWFSSNPEVAKYNEETGCVESYSDGDTTITCMIEGKSYTCKVSVKE